MNYLALKIDVDTYRGTREGVPRLLELLKSRGVGATFLFSLGPDHTGRAIKRLFRPGFIQKVSRTSIIEHYGIWTLLYGTLLVGPDIGLRCKAILKEVARSGFETGIHAWDHTRWQNNVTNQDAAWTIRELDLASQRYRDLFELPPMTQGAAGWQMNRSAFQWEQRTGMAYASDTRGTHPFWPIVEGEPIYCVQLPTTLPTLDELLGTNRLSAVDKIHECLLKLTQTRTLHGHVYTLHAELEGMKLLPVFERLLDGWIAQGYQIVSMKDFYATIDLSQLPYHEISTGEIPGRSGTLALQGPRFLG